MSGLKEKLLAHLYTWLPPVIGTALLSGLVLAEDRLAPLIPAPQAIWAVRAIGVSTLLLSLLVASIFIFKPRLKFSAVDGGCYIDRKTGIRYCTSCYVSKKHLSPMVDDDIRWFCQVSDCKQKYLKRLK
jgi:hypothetical protein